MSWAQGLGRVFDLSAGIVPVNASGAASSGSRVSLRNCSAVTFVLFKGAGTAGDDPSVYLYEHTASSAGTSQVLSKIDTVYTKQETTLDGDETWTKNTQTAASAYAGNATSAEEQAIWAFTIGADQLSDGYKYLSLDIPSPGNNTQLVSVLYILHDLNVQRTPANLVAPLS